ncbi:uncharacterized protein LOC141855887 [Brevipalpus obovatus]|uniref:uncharacterized protein LOC141855887 n=1 Tax=Brevipalpus obovatus TaxID=246614 RepID=UPI003D9EDD12
MKPSLLPIILTIVIMFVILYKVSNGFPHHDHLRHIFRLTRRQKLEFAKKLAAALLMTYRSKKFLLPLPFPVPIPIPVFNTYQPIMADPLFFKWLTVKENLAGLGNAGFGGGIHG